MHNAESPTAESPTAESPTAEATDSDFSPAILRVMWETRSTESQTFRMSEHATQRMYARAMNYKMVHSALKWGTVIYAKGAAHHIVRDKDVERRDQLEEKHRGVRVVVDPDSGTVMTVYRNKGSLPAAQFPELILTGGQMLLRAAGATLS